MSASKSFVRGIWRSTAYRSFALLWIAALLVVAATDWHSLLIGLGAASFAAILITITVRLVRVPNSSPADALRATGSPRQLSLQSVIITLACVWALLYGWGYGSLLKGGEKMFVPRLSPLMLRLFTHQNVPLHDTWGTYFGFMTLVLTPGLALLLCGRTPRSLGLVAPATSVGWATLACIGLALVFAAIGLATHKITLATLALLLLHNFFSNGFAEEFVSRGMVLSQLRSRVSEDWAMILQASFFSVYHFGSTMPEPNVHLNILFALANNFALNAPLGIALGVMAVRGKSLLQGTIVHMFLDTMTKTM
jgi:membrane protease YdiL (CAAX protease family)